MPKKVRQGPGYSSFVSTTLSVDRLEEETRWCQPAAAGLQGGTRPWAHAFVFRAPTYPMLRWAIGGSQPLTIAISTISTRQASFPLPVLVCYQVRQRSPNCHQG